MSFEPHHNNKNNHSFILNLDLSKAMTRMLEARNNTLKNKQEKKKGCEHQRKIIKKPYKCPYCNKSFAKPSALTPHVYTHTGEKPFQCHIQGCHKRFAVISNLRRHFKVHQPKKSNSKNRMSRKERFMLVCQLAEQHDISNDNTTTTSITTPPPPPPPPPAYVHPTYPTTLLENIDTTSTMPSTTTTTFATSAPITPMPTLLTNTPSSIDINPPHTYMPLSASSFSSSSSSWKLCEEFNYIDPHDPFVYSNSVHMNTASSITSSPPLDLQRSTDALYFPPVLPSSPSNYSFHECNLSPVTPDYLSSFDNPVVGLLPNHPIDSITQWINHN